MEKDGTVTVFGKAAINAHAKLLDGQGLSFLNIFKEGAEWMAEQTKAWINDNVDNYVTWDGEVYKDELTTAFLRDMEKIINGEQL